MKYHKKIKLKDGRECVIRNGEEADGKAAFEVFDLTHKQTDNLLSYADENSFTVEQESAFLKAKTESEREIELIAEVEGKAVGLAGIEAVGNKFKVLHRAEFGISIDKEYWGLGIGKAMTDACIECARKAGYEQLELNVISDNEAAVSLYEKAGFTEYGRDPKGFKSRISGYQEVVYMRMEL